VVSLGATAVVDLSRRGSHQLTVAAHAAPGGQWSAPASGAFCQDVLERLAVAAGTADDQLEASVNRLLEATPPGTRLIVFSTRSVDIEQLIGEVEAAHGRQRVALAQALWVDVTRYDLASLFTLD
jgi:hypothetical protein